MESNTMFEYNIKILEALIKDLKECEQIALMDTKADPQVVISLVDVQTSLVNAGYYIEGIRRHLKI